MAKVTLDIQYEPGGVSVTMPPAGNRWISGMGFFLGIPYLLVMLGSIPVAWYLAPSEFKREFLLGTIAFNLLMGIATMLAIAGVWLAFYNMWGRETIHIGSEGVVLRRHALRIAVPIKLARRGPGSIEVLDPSLYTGNWPHPRLEIRSGRTAARLGAGLTAEEAELVRTAVASVLVGAGEVEAG